MLMVYTQNVVVFPFELYLVTIFELSRGTGSALWVACANDIRGVQIKIMQIWLTGDGVL